MTTTTIGRRAFLQTGIGGAAFLAGGSLVASMTGCSSPPVAAHGFSFLRPADVELLRPLIPAVLGDAIRDDDSVMRVLALLDGTLVHAGPAVRRTLFQLYDVLQLGAARWWLTGSWAHPRELPAEDRARAVEAWSSKDNWFARIAFRGLTQPLMMVWYAEPDNGPDIGYPGPPRKVVG